MARFAAVDLGASSGRVLLGRLGDGAPSLVEAHRFANRPVRLLGTLYWDVLSLYQEVLIGLRRSENLDGGGELDAVGVDSWGVDYGLLDESGALLSNPIHYRDERTTHVVDKVLAAVSANRLYATTGIQHQPFNTIFQLAAEKPDLLAVASTAMLIPDLIGFWLSNVRGTELTNASTTGLLDARTRSWSTEIAASAGIRLDLFAPLREPASAIAPIIPSVRTDAGLASTPSIIAVPSHDTAAAVAGVPADTDRFAFVCTGTWALVGVELAGPVLTDDARASNFTNELGVGGRIRFLRNVTGFWLLQECIRAWRAGGMHVDAATLTHASRDVPSLRAMINVQDPAFSTPGDMPARIRNAVGDVALTSPAEVTRCILDSMALAVRHAIRDAVRLSGRDVDVVHVVGGGVASDVFCQAVADACALPVLAGPIEAAAWGNAISQAQALGIVPPGPEAGRAVVRAAEPLVRYDPRPDNAAWSRADEVVLGRPESAPPRDLDEHGG